MNPVAGTPGDAVLTVRALQARLTNQAQELTLGKPPSTSPSPRKRNTCGWILGCRALDVVLTVQRLRPRNTSFCVLRRRHGASPR